MFSNFALPRALRLSPIFLYAAALPCLIASGGGASAKLLTLDSYLNEVQQRHFGFLAADQTAKAARLYSDEGSLVFKPTLFANAANTADARNNPLQVGDGVMAGQSYSLGVSQQTSIGLSGKLSYNYLGLQVPSIPISPLLSEPESSYYTGYGQIELSQSLFRNFLGAEYKAEEEAATNGAIAKSHAQSFLSRSILFEAETNYWRLALARDMMKMQEEALARARKISDWTNRRMSMRLTDRTEIYQASTNLQARQLDLQTAKDEEHVAAQAFNSSRSTISDVVPETLADLGPERTKDMRARGKVIGYEPGRQREDVVAAEFQAKAEFAGAILAREKDRPTLEVFGSTPITDPAALPATISGILPLSSRPSTTVGIRLVAPLDVSTLYKAYEGHNAEAEASDWTYRRKIFEAQRDWADLVAKFNEAKARLNLYVELERTQKEKLDFERDKQSRGRSTLEQVFLFENDYTMARLGRLRTVAELLTLNAQMKLYEGVP